MVDTKRSMEIYVVFFRELAQFGQHLRMDIESAKLKEGCAWLFVVPVPTGSQVSLKFKK